MSTDLPQPPLGDLAAVAPTIEQVRIQLRRILQSDSFDASERNRTFLTFVVEETLAGRSQYIKGYTVACRVFRRESDFDPQLDPVVRIEASRLRRSLELYYLTAGKADSVHIELPKGGYVPRFTIFEERDISNLPNRSRQTSQRTPTANACSRAGYVPSIVVCPFETLSPDPDIDLIAKGIEEELITRLTLGRKFDVVSIDIRAKLAPFCDSPKIDRSLTFAVSGSVRRASTRLRVHVRLADLEHAIFFWAESFDRDISSSVDIESAQDEIADAIANRLMAPSGVTLALCAPRPDAEQTRKRVRS